MKLNETIKSGSVARDKYRDTAMFRDNENKKELARETKKERPVILKGTRRV